MSGKPSNRAHYLPLFVLASVLVWLLLLTVRADNPRLDLFVYGEIALAAAIAVTIMVWNTRKWTVRGLGLLGLMLAIMLLYTPGLLRELSLMHDMTPNWFTQFRRALLIVSGPCLLYGFWVWWHEEDGDL